MANDLLVTLNNIQLAAGFIRPILEDTDLRLDYINQGWITSMRKRFGEVNFAIWIEEVWQPKLQQVNNTVIMELFADAAGATQRDLEKCNQVRCT